MNIKLLKSIRIIAYIPYLILLVQAIYCYRFGLGGYGSTTYGIHAFLELIFLFGVYFFWIFAISLVTIIVTTILIKKHK